MLVEALLLIGTPHCHHISLDRAVADYAARVQAMDTAGIAALYGKDGQLVGGGKTLVGGEAIAGFLGEFAAYRVTHEAMETSATVRIPGRWRATGRFAQVGTTPGGGTYATHGRFAMDWRCSPKRGWRVLRLETTGD